MDFSGLDNLREGHLDSLHFSLVLDLHDGLLNDLGLGLNSAIFDLLLDGLDSLILLLGGVNLNHLKNLIASLIIQSCLYSIT